MELMFSGGPELSFRVCWDMLSAPTLFLCCEWMPLQFTPQLGPA